MGPFKRILWYYEVRFSKNPKQDTPSPQVSHQSATKHEQILLLVEFPFCPGSFCQTCAIKLFIVL